MKPVLTVNGLIFILLVIPSSYSDPPIVALNPERLQLLDDALSWLTLRAGGDLLDPPLHSRLLKTLNKEYSNNPYFRTIVIAFQLGVLPKLTLQQGQPCDPAYTLRYRSKLNNSVTWFKMRNFTLENYSDLKKPSSSSGPYCDYRQGLVCLPTTKTCNCPEGSEMSPIEANSQVQRCLLEEDELCPYGDIITLRDISKLTAKLPELIFNLEKPLSCKHGTTCRLKNPEPFPKCWSLSKAPFENNNGPTRSYGEECLLDYIGEGGGCSVYTIGNGYVNVCFNFFGYVQNRRLSSSNVYKRKGKCALGFTPYVTPGITSATITGDSPTNEVLYPFVTAFVNPGTVMMSSSELLDYDKTLHKITRDYNAERKAASIWNEERKSRIQQDVGEPCSVADTAKMVDIWNFFTGLEKVPPQGQDFVADVPTLKAKLAEYKTLIDKHTDFEPRICRIYWGKGWRNFIPPLTCIKTGTGPDATGNDGTCQISNNNDTLALALNIQTFADDDYKSKDEVRNGNKTYDRAILLDNPEVACIPSQRKKSKRTLNFPRPTTQDPHTHGEVSDGGICAEGFACVEDFNEIHGIYKNAADKKDCNLEAGYQPKFFCLDVVSDKDKVKWNTCEEDLLDQRVMNAVQTAPRLGMGAPCNLKLAQEIYTFYSHYDRHKTNRYGILLDLESNGICDQTKLLVCTNKNICGCGGTRYAARKSADNKYVSDYCYLTSGWCGNTVSDDDNFYIPLTAAEKAELDKHYGTRSSRDSCENLNVCVFIDACTGRCTTVNTGSTGVDVDVIGGCVPSTTTTDKPPVPTGTDEPPLRPLEPAVPFNGAESSFKKQSRLGVGVVIIMIVFLNGFTLVCKLKF